MTIIDLKPVRRCGNCRHLIPASMDDCPYCSQRAYAKRKAVVAEEENVAVKPLSPVAKKRIIIGAVVVGLVLVVLFVWQTVANMFVLNKSILEPLDDSVVESQMKDDPTFGTFYYEVSRLRDFVTSPEDKEKYKDITYNDFRNFYDAYTSELYCNQVKEKADAEYDEKVLAPMNARVDSVVAVWETFMDEHNIDKYITITTHNTTYNDHPAWYYVINNLGKVTDCQAEVVYSGSWSGDVTLHRSLAEMEEVISPDNMTYLTGEYAFGDDFWDRHELTVNIKSVTLKDGKVITSEDINEVPYAVRGFLEDNSEDSRVNLIQSTIDSEFPWRGTYQILAVQKNLKEKYEHCYELVDRVESVVGYPVLSRGF